LVGRTCSHRFADGHFCAATPLRGRSQCFWHAPDKGQQAAEARRLGGLRRRREKAVAAAFDFGGLGTIESIRRLVEIAALDALGMENTVARGRLLLNAAAVAEKLLEVGDLEARLALLEARVERTP
jgi:hypothetical protein